MSERGVASAAIRSLARAHVVSSPDALVEALARAAGCDGSELWLMGGDRRLRFAAGWYAEGLDAEPLREAARAIAYDPAQRFAGGTAVWIDTIDPAQTPRSDEFARAGISSALAVPMLTRGGVVGALVFFSTGKELPDRSVLDELSDIASVAAVICDARNAAAAVVEAQTRLASLTETSKRLEHNAAMLRRVASAVDTRGERVFDVLARELAHAVGTESAVIGAIHPENRVYTIGGWNDGRPAARRLSNIVPPVAKMIATRAAVAGAASVCDDPSVLELGVGGYLARPLLDSDGNVIGFAAALSREPLSISDERDAALRIVANRAAAELERLRLDERAQSATEHFHAFTEAVDDSVITMDDCGVIQSVNAAAVRGFGYAREELVGASISLIMPAPHAAQHEHYLRRYLAGGTAADLTVGRDVRGQRKDGSLLPLRLSVVETRQAGRRIFTGILRDLSDFVGLRQDLQRSRAVIADTQRLTHIGNWVWDLQTGRMEWSDEIFRIFGRSRSEFEPTFEKLLACVHAEDRRAVEAAVETALRDQSSDSIEHRVVRPDGSEVTVCARGEVQAEDGRIVRIIGTVQDVTESHRAHERVARLSSAVEQTADQVMITDRDGRIEYVNRAFEEASGYSREAVIGQTPRILKSGKHTLAFYKNVWATLLDGEVFRGVFANRRSDGTIIYEEKTIGPIRRADGVITHFVSTSRDISERMRVEAAQEDLRRALTLSSTEWRLTFDAIEFPVFVCGSDGIVRRANAAAQKLSGIPFAELIGSRLQDLPHCEPWIGAAEVLARAAAGESVSTQVQEPVSRRTWELAAMPFSGDSGSLVIFVARDLTHLLHLQDSLRRTEVMSTLGALVAGVAHEVRNPLFAISATIDAFEGRALDQASFDDFTRRLRGELGRLTELMADLLEYGRPAEPELRPGSPRAALESALESTAPLASSLDVTIDAAFGAGESGVMLDERRLAIAFRNLLDNAVRHSPRGSRVELRMHDGADGVEITVRDHGSGFDDGDLPHLFEPFFTRRRGGTGLGLSIVHRTIEQHGGSVKAENDPDGGALIRVLLPRVERAA